MDIERERNAKVARNLRKMEALGIKNPGGQISGVVQPVKKEEKKRRKEKKQLERTGATD